MGFSVREKKEKKRKQRETTKRVKRAGEVENLTQKDAVAKH